MNDQRQTELLGCLVLLIAVLLSGWIALSIYRFIEAIARSLT